MREFPKKIICLTEESVETLYALGLEERIIGVSAYVKRPVEAQSLPKVSVFTHANLKKIADMKPDLVMGFSDIQKDIARDLIGLGINVYISNQRSLDEILDYILMLGSMMGKRHEALSYVSELEEKIEYAKEVSASFKRRPKVYLEEWDEPRLCGIKWFSEIIEICGGIDVFKDRSDQSLAKGRTCNDAEIVSRDPDFIFGCWCGKKVDIDSIHKRAGYHSIAAVKSNRVIELEPEIFLQPGPAPIVSGIDLILEYFKEFQTQS